MDLRRTWRRGARDDGGQLMLLAGIVVTLAFMLTALTLSQMSALERQAASDPPADLPREWRFIHERVAVSLQTAVTPAVTNETFGNVTFPSIAATFRNVEVEKGYDSVMRLANHTFDESEADLKSTTGDTYDAWSADGRVWFQQTWDGSDDGFIFETPCPDAMAPSGGCIVGVYVFIQLSDGVNTMQETVLFPVDQTG